MPWFSFLHGNEPSGETVLVAGLGNPGEKYSETRHNMGFKVIDALAETLDVQVRQRKFGGRFAMTPASGKKLILLKPWEFMNRSGQAVATTVGFYKLPLDRILVVYDDMALAVGQIRVRARFSISALIRPRSWRILSPNSRAISLPVVESGSAVRTRVTR